MFALLPFVIPKTTCLNTYLAHISTVLGTGGSQKLPEDALWKSLVDTNYFHLLSGVRGTGFWVSGMVVKHSPCLAPLYNFLETWAHMHVGILRCPQQVCLV